VEKNLDLVLIEEQMLQQKNGASDTKGFLIFMFKSLKGQSDCCSMNYYYHLQQFF